MPEIITGPLDSFDKINIQIIWKTQIIYDFQQRQIDESPGKEGDFTV